MSDTNKRPKKDETEKEGVVRTHAKTSAAAPKPLTASSRTPLVTPNKPAATAATAPLLSSSEQAIKTTDFAVGLFDGSSTLALPLPCIYFFALDARQDGGEDEAIVEAEGGDEDEREQEEHRSVPFFSTRRSDFHFFFLR